MRISRWSLTLAAFSFLLSMSAPTRIASAGCWECQYDPGIGAYDCVGLGENNDGWDFCTPEWDFDDVWCKFSGNYGACINPHCVGCVRTPALPAEPDPGEPQPGGSGPRRPQPVEPPPLLTSEIIFFSLGDVTTALDLSPLPVNVAAGLDASEAAAMLKARTGVIPKVVAYEARTSARFTTVRYTGADKSQLLLLAHATPNGFVVRTFEKTERTPLHARARARVSGGQAAIVPVTIDGMSCVAVIYSQQWADGSSLEAAAESRHEQFTDAVHRYSVRDMISLKVDAPRSSAVGLEPWTLQALADDALASAMRTANY